MKKLFNVLKQNINTKLIIKLQNRINNLSVRKKTLIAPLFSALFILILGIVFFGGITKQRDLIDDINMRYRIYNESAQIIEKLIIVHTNLYKGFVWKSAGYEIERIKKLIDNQFQDLAKVEKKIKEIIGSDLLLDDEKKTFDSILKNFKEYEYRSKIAVECIFSDDISTAPLIMQMGDDQFNILYKNLSALMTVQSIITQESHDKSLGSFRFFSFTTLAFIIIFIVLSIIVSIIISGYIEKPIRRIIDFLHESSKGDAADGKKALDIKTGDEIGEFAIYFNKFIADINKANETRDAAMQELKAINGMLVETKDALWGEMEMAKKIQTILLPKKPNASGYDIAVYIDPADEVGGDYYDIVNVNGKDWVVIGDVSGHGIPAGLIMMMVQTSIRSVLAGNPDIKPSELLEITNKVIHYNIQKLGEDKYMTITALALHERGKLYFSGLHQDILIYRAKENRLETIESRGMWIGIDGVLKGMVYDDSFNVETNDTILLFTDGITESMIKRGKSEEMYGPDKLKEIFLANGAKTPEEIKNEIIKSLIGYSPSDDVAIVILKKI